MRASLIRFLALAGHGAVLRAPPDNCSMTEWSWTGARWWLRRFNDAAHLDTQQWAGASGLRIQQPDWVKLDSGASQSEADQAQQVISGSKM